MTFPDMHPRRTACTLILIAALVLVAFSAGCTQQKAAPGPVTAQKTDLSHITVAFVGGPGTETLLELEVTVTGSNGKSITQSLGSRIGTTPLQLNASGTFTGTYTSNSHVLVTGYFSDGTKKTMLDTTL